MCDRKTLSKPQKKEKTKTGIRKNIFPHSLRHTTATYDGDDLQDRDMQYKFGWAHKSPTARRYSKANEQNLLRTLKSNANITDDLINNKSTCTKCNKQVSITEDYCPQCNTPLTQQAFLEIQQKEEQQKELQKQESIELKNEISNLKEKIEKLTDGYNKIIDEQDEEHDKEIEEIFNTDKMLKQVDYIFNRSVLKE